MKKLILFVVSGVVLGVLALTTTACGGSSSTTASSSPSASASAAAVMVTTLAGQGTTTPGSADGTGAAASFNLPTGIAIDSAGNLYVCDQHGNTIRKVTPAGLVTTFAGKAGVKGSADGTGAAARFDEPALIVCNAAGDLYVTDSSNDTIRKITPAGVVTTFAGKAGKAGSADGKGAAARFNTPAGIAIDAAGNLYVTDAGNYTIRKITPAGVVTTLAGKAGRPGTADGTGAAARFMDPEDIAVDATGNLYASDLGDYTIRKIATAGQVTTFAGTIASAGVADGRGTAASFNMPCDIAVDSSGNLYVADLNADTIRKITPAAVVTTFAGKPYQGNVTNGSLAVARFAGPVGIAINAAGDLYVSEWNGNDIREITFTK